MRTFVVTGSASGIGGATRARLVARGDRVIGVDIRDADVQVDRRQMHRLGEFRGVVVGHRLAVLVE